jgi:hypothetical protein
MVSYASKACVRAFRLSCAFTCEAGGPVTLPAAVARPNYSVNSGGSGAPFSTIS